jgi:NTP pyrophosphatase (non-canonical NTP hydrolase)
MTAPSLSTLRDELRDFARRRSWERYHSPKNLTTAIASEAGELAAVLQWAGTDEDIDPYREELEDEIADVLIYLVRLADVLDIDLIEVAMAKIVRNEDRYPAL